MKRFKLATYAIVFTFVLGLSACGEDPVLEEIIDETELRGPSFDTGERPRTQKPPKSD